jgi:hypothetical protein
VQNGRLQGACGPFFIHADKSKNKAKEAEERERQQNGEAPSAPKVSAQFTNRLEDSPDALVATTHSGSMTQEVFSVRKPLH